MLDFTRGKPMTDSFNSITKMVNFDVTGDFKTISADKSLSEQTGNESFLAMATASIKADKAGRFGNNVNNDDDDIMIG